MGKGDIVKGYRSPEACGLDSREVLRCIREMDASENEIHGFVAERGGYIFAESYLAPYAGDLPHTCHSLGKSYTCTAVGIVCTQGLLSVDDRITDLFGEELAQWGIVPDEAMKELRLRHLMSMSVGMERMPALDEHWMENFLREPVKYTPGTRFLYNSTGSCMLGAAVEKVTGMDLETYMRRHLFDKIGIGARDLVWRRFENGVCAEPGISATTGANLRLGMLYLAGGAVDGEQIISREWIEQAISRQVANGDGRATNDQNSGYGWQLWLCHPDSMVRFDGGQGQFCLLDRSRDMAVAIHQGGWHPGGAYQMLVKAKELLQSAAEHPLPENPAAHRELTAYLRRRALPEGKVSRIPEGADGFSGVYRVTEGMLNPWIEVAPEQEDFYHLFYEPSFRSEIRCFSLELEADCIRVCWNGLSQMEFRLDGRWERGETPTPLVGLGAYAGTAYFEDEDVLHFTLKWLNGWCTPELILRRADSATLEIAVYKDMLHEGRAPFERHCTARRVR